MTTLLSIVCVILLFIALILLGVGFGTPNWATTTVGNIGLWQTCNPLTGCSSHYSSDVDDIRGTIESNIDKAKDMPTWFLATEALVSAGVLCVVIGVLISPFYLCNCCKKARSCGMTIGVFLIFGVLCLAVGLALFGAKVSEQSLDFQLGGGYLNDFDWSYWVTVGGGAVALIDALMFIAVAKKSVYE